MGWFVLTLSDLWILTSQLVINLLVGDERYATYPRLLSESVVVLGLWEDPSMCLYSKQL